MGGRGYEGEKAVVDPGRNSRAQVPDVYGEDLSCGSGNGNRGTPYSVLDPPIHHLDPQRTSQ